MTRLIALLAVATAFGFGLIACAAPVDPVQSSPADTSPSPSPGGSPDSTPSPGPSAPLPEPRYSISYDGNGNTSGFVPTDGLSYQSGAFAQILGNSGSMTRNSDYFAGWSTQKASGGSLCPVGSIVTIAQTDLKLYAVWLSSKPTTVNVTFIYQDLEGVIHAADTPKFACSANSWAPVSMSANADRTAFSATLSLPACQAIQYEYVVFDATATARWNWLQTANRSLSTIAGDMFLHDTRQVVPGWIGSPSPASLNLSAGAASGTIYAQTYVSSITDASGQGRGLTAQIGYGTSADHSNWTWSAMAYQRDIGNNDEYAGSFTAPVAGTYRYTVRFDGNAGIGNPNAGWHYPDTDSVLTVH
jgi:hypothetical protein